MHTLAIATARLMDLGFAQVAFLECRRVRTVPAMEETV